MPPLIACAACGQHVLSSACSCAHCGVKLKDCSLRSSSAAALMGLTLGSGLIAGCEAEYGAVVSYDDEDGDGYYAQQDDCDDTDAAINPGAIDTVDDGIDSNCDGEDNT